MAGPAAESSKQQGGSKPATGAGKPKTAKDIKKEKRAAAVAARGPTNGDARPRPDLSPKAASPDVSIIQSDQSSRPTTSNAAGPSSPVVHAPPPIPTFVRMPRPSSHSESSSSSHLSSHQYFAHLPRLHQPDTALAFHSGRLHPAVIELGVLMSSGTLRGANARTMGMMVAFQEVIDDYETPESSVLWKDLPVHLSPMIAWLEACRPKGVGGGNAIRWLKAEINKLGDGDMRGEDEQKAHLVDAIDLYIRDRIELADQIIVEHAQEKIRPGCTVVTFARSSIVERVLLETWANMKKDREAEAFQVVVVDSRPLNEGRFLVSSLSSAGIPCTYILLPLLSTVLPDADLVLLGAAALHSDGALFSRAGTSLVAMLAKEHRVPVVACVETYKFGEKVALDGISSNEIGDPDDILDTSINKCCKLSKISVDGGNLTPLSLMYDLTPPNLITTVCTELGFIPPSSVPTVLGKASGVA